MPANDNDVEIARYNMQATKERWSCIMHIFFWIAAAATMVGIAWAVSYDEVESAKARYRMEQR